MVVTEDVRNDSDAHALLRVAHDSGYRFPEGFGGFEATLNANVNGETIRGTVTVRAPRDIQLDTPDGEATSWVKRELASMAGHRWHLPYEQADGRNTLTLDPDETDPLGRHVIVHNDDYDSSYRVANGQISQVNRTMGPMRFSIIIQDRAVVGGGLLPNHFTVAFWDTASGRLTRSDIYADRYTDIDGVWLPSSRNVITADGDGLCVRSFALTEQTLLAGTSGEAHLHTLEKSGLSRN